MSTVIGFLSLMVVWIAFCELQDYVLMIEESSYIMLYGFFAGLVSSLPYDFIKGVRK